MRKRILFTAIALLALTLQGRAQKFLEIFQDGVVINRVLASVVDSITMAETVPPTINMWHSGSIFLSYYYNDIDSITVSYEDYPVSYIGVVGFNDDLYKKGVGILAPSTVGSYKSFINGLPQKDGSLLYYAVDNALDMLEEADITTPLKSVHFITFTDGLDLGSIMMQDNYLSTREYLNAMSTRIRQTQIEDLPLNAYTVGLRGNDVTNVEQFQNNLICLASTEDNAFEVSNINELRSRFSEIANKIINVSTRQTVSVKIPGTDSGTRMRFVFDGMPASESSLYIEGTFNLRDRSLCDVTYHGMKARSGSTVQGTQVGIFVTFTFTGLQRLDGNGMIPMGNIKHYYQTSNTSDWQVNSEFSPGNNSQQSVTYTGTSLFLVLDCSSSLGGDFSRMKSYANEFIDMIAGNALPVVMNPPQHVTATMDPNDFAVNVSWDVVKYAKSYKVFRSNSSGTNILVADNITATNWKDRNPSVGNNSYRVSAIRGDLESGQSASASLNCPFDAPKNVKAALADNDFVVNVSWDAVTYAKSYKVFRSNSSYGTYTLVAENITSTKWVDRNPLSGNNYYKVSAVRGDIESSQSGYASVTCSLGTPQNVTAALDDNDFVVNVSWDAVTYAKSYKVFRSSSKSGAYTLVKENITSTTWTDTNPNAGDNYYKVSAVRGEMESSQSNYAFVKYVLNAPQNVTAAIDDNAFVVNVSWDAVKYAKSYKVFRSNSSYGTYTLVAENITSTKWTDTNPLSGNNYYKVCTVRGEMESSQSGYASVNYALNTPQDVTATLDDNDFVVHVSWSAVKHAKCYRVSRSKSKTGTYTILAESLTTTSWTDPNPMIGDNYYKVEAFYDDMKSDMSNYAYVKCTFNAPQNVTASLDDNELVINVSWSAVKYAKSYKVFRSKSSSGTYTLVAENISTTTWTDTNPLVGSNYYKVSAVCGELESSQSGYAYVEFEKPLCPDGNHPHMIDLGLPDGTKWACCNVGATSPESYGGYYAWGETEEKDDYDWSTYLYCNGSISTMTKYCIHNSYGYNGFTDGLTELLPEDDAATANWGSGWQMPTVEQFQELINSEYTTTEWTTLNGVKGRKITSKSNGNSIFLPAAGYRSDASLYDVGSYGHYWSRSLETYGSNYARSLYFRSGYISTYDDYRYCGQSVRPVRVQN